MQKTYVTCFIFSSICWLARNRYCLFHCILLHFPIAQVSKRQSELESIKHYRSSGNLTKHTLSVRVRDSCFHNYCLLKEKLLHGKYKCDIIKSSNVDDLFKNPLESRTFDIGIISNINRITLKSKILSKCYFLKKVVILPWRNGFVFFPMLHEMERK